MIPVISLFFATMGALENMQEEIIPLVPALLCSGGLRIDAVAVVAMSAGAAMVGSAFGPTNPFQAGIALRLAELPPCRAVACGSRCSPWASPSGLRGRAAVHARVREEDANRPDRRTPRRIDTANLRGRRGCFPQRERRHMVVLSFVLPPMAAYVYGAFSLGWGFNELSAAFFIGGLVAGLAGGWV